MTLLVVYLLKANAVLALFAAAYYGLLRRLTFFELNRVFLLLALLFAAVYPALPVPALLPPAVAAWPLPSEQLAMRLPRATTLAQTHDYTPYVLSSGIALYGLGTGLLLLRLLGQLLSLVLVRWRSRPAVVLGQRVRVVPGTGGPFSFGTTIYLSAAALADTAALPAMLRHEQVHVRQWHTLDVLLTQVAVALAWINPAAWLLRRAVLDNLEYLADRAALQTGLDRRAYQYCLLHQQPGGVPVPALAFHFSFLTLKNRIRMLNQPLSSTRQLGRYFLAAPLVMALALGYSSAQAQVVPTPAPAPKTSLQNATIYVDGKLFTGGDLNAIDPATIAAINVLKDDAERKAFGSTAGKGTVLVTTKANANSPEVVAFNNRINGLVPLTPATPAQESAIAAAAAYITKNYPAAKQEGISIVKGQSDRYQAVFVEAGKRRQLIFDGSGQPVKR